MIHFHLTQTQSSFHQSHFDFQSAGLHTTLTMANIIQPHYSSTWTCELCKFMYQDDNLSLEGFYKSGPNVNPSAYVLRQEDFNSDKGPVTIYMPRENFMAFSKALGNRQVS